MEVVSPVKVISKNMSQNNEVFAEYLTSQKPTKLEFPYLSLNSENLDTLLPYLELKTVTSFTYKQALGINVYDKFYDLIHILIRPLSNLRELKIFKPPRDHFSKTLSKAINLWMEMGDNLVLCIHASLATEFSDCMFNGKENLGLVELELVNVNLSDSVWKRMINVERITLKNNNMNESSWEAFCSFLTETKSLVDLRVYDNVKGGKYAEVLGIALAQRGCLKSLEVGGEEVTIGTHILRSLQGIFSMTSYSFEFQKSVMTPTYEEFWTAIDQLLDSGTPLMKVVLQEGAQAKPIPHEILEKLNENSMRSSMLSFDQNKVLKFLNSGTTVRCRSFKLVLIDDYKHFVRGLVRQRTLEGVERKKHHVSSYTLQKTCLHKDSPNYLKTNSIAVTSKLWADVEIGAQVIRTLNRTRRLLENDTNTTIDAKIFSNYSSKIGLTLGNITDDEPHLELANVWCEYSYDMNVSNPFIRYNDTDSLYWVCFDLIRCCGENFEREMKKVISFVQKVPDKTNSRVVIIGLVHKEVESNLEKLGCSIGSLKKLIAKSISRALSEDDKGKIIRKGNTTGTEEAGSRNWAMKNNDAFVFYLGVSVNGIDQDNDSCLWQAFHTFSRKLASRRIDPRWYLVLGAIRSEIESENADFVFSDKFDEEAILVGIEDRDIKGILQHFEDVGELLQIDDLVFFDRHWLQNRIKQLFDFKGSRKKKSNGIVYRKDIKRIWSGLNSSVVEKLTTFAVKSNLLIEIDSKKENYFIAHCATKTTGEEDLLAAPVFCLCIPNNMDISLFFGIYCGFLLKTMKARVSLKKCGRHTNYLFIRFSQTSNSASLSLDNRNRINFRLDHQTRNQVHEFLQESEAALSETLDAISPINDDLHAAPCFLLPFRGSNISREIVFVGENLSAKGAQKADLLLSLISFEKILVLRKKPVETLQDKLARPVIYFVEGSVDTEPNIETQETLQKFVSSENLIICGIHMREDELGNLRERFSVNDETVVKSCSEGEDFITVALEVLGEVRKRIGV